MPSRPVLIVASARSAVVPVGGGFRSLHVHELASPVVRALLERTPLKPQQVDALVMGNALAAGGNPARMVSLASGLADNCPAFSVDTQCCSGLDAIGMGVNMIASGQANIVIAGGAEAWSRAPIRQHRPLHPGENPVSYTRPAFAPDPARDPELLEAAARFARQNQYSRNQQNDYAYLSHCNALAHREHTARSIVSIAQVHHDTYPRELQAERLPRIPLACATPSSLEDSIDCGVSQLAVSTKADGAAFVLLMSESACRQHGCTPHAKWLAHTSVGHAPEMPLLAAEAATAAVLTRAGLENKTTSMQVELHDAFAVQGMAFQKRFDFSQTQLNGHGGGLARGHPIGASGAVALVNLLSRLQANQPTQALGLVAIAAAGGLGSAAILQSAET